MLLRAVAVLVLVTACSLVACERSSVESDALDRQALLSDAQAREPLLRDFIGIYPHASVSVVTYSQGGRKSQYGRFVNASATVADRYIVALLLPVQARADGKALQATRPPRLVIRRIESAADGTTYTTPHVLADEDLSAFLRDADARAQYFDSTLSPVAGFRPDTAIPGPRDAWGEDWGDLWLAGDE